MNFYIHILLLLQVLFELAQFHAPSTIFMDELESIMGQRAGGLGYAPQCPQCMFMVASVCVCCQVGARGK